MRQEFIKPWMTKCNPDLIVRFWESKGCPGEITLIIFGLNITFIKTPLGILRYLKKGDSIS